MSFDRPPGIRGHVGPNGPIVIKSDIGTEDRGRDSFRKGVQATTGFAVGVPIGMYLYYLSMIALRNILQDSVRLTKPGWVVGGLVGAVAVGYSGNRHGFTGVLTPAGVAAGSAGIGALMMLRGTASLSEPYRFRTVLAAMIVAGALVGGLGYLGGRFLDRMTG